jgi:hypothetical protein
LIDEDATIADYIPLTNVLRRRYGDPVSHYTARAKSVHVNGYPLLGGGIGRGSRSNPILVIFDTGVTGMVVSRNLFNEQYVIARQRKQKTLFGNVTLTFATAGGGDSVQTLSAVKPLTTPFDPETTWKRFPKDSHLIIVGLAFLNDRVVTVDIDKERLRIV